MQAPDQALSRRDREKLFKRQEILIAAQEVFAEKGFSQTTLQDIADRAEFGKGTLYNYFPLGKQEILLAIFETLFDHLRKVIHSSFQSSVSTTFQHQLNAFLEATFRLFEDKMDLFIILIREAHRMGDGEDPTPQTFFLQQRNSILKELAIPIELAIQKGEIRPMSAYFLAHLIMVNVNGCQMKSCNLWSETASETGSETPETAAEMAGFLTRMLCQGVASSNQT